MGRRLCHSLPAFFCLCVLWALALCCGGAEEAEYVGGSRSWIHSSWNVHPDGRRRLSANDSTLVIAGNAISNPEFNQSDYSSSDTYQTIDLPSSSALGGIWNWSGCGEFVYDPQNGDLYLGPYSPTIGNLSSNVSISSASCNGYAALAYQYLAVFPWTLYDFVVYFGRISSECNYSLAEIRVGGSNFSDVLRNVSQDDAVLEQKLYFYSSPTYVWLSNAKGSESYCDTTKIMSVSLNQLCYQNLPETLTAFGPSFASSSYITFDSSTSFYTNWCLNSCSCTGFEYSPTGGSSPSPLFGNSATSEYYASRQECSQNMANEFLPIITGYDFPYNDIFRITSVNSSSDCENQCLKICNCQLAMFTMNINWCWIKTAFYYQSSGLSTGNTTAYSVKASIRKCGSNLTTNFIQRSGISYPTVYQSFAGLNLGSCRFTCASNCQCLAFVIDPSGNCSIITDLEGKVAADGYSAYVRLTLDELGTTVGESTTSLIRNPNFGWSQFYIDGFVLKSGTQLSGFIYDWEIVNGVAKIIFESKANSSIVDGEEISSNLFSFCSQDQVDFGEITQTFETEPSAYYEFSFSAGTDNVSSGNNSILVSLDDGLITETFSLNYSFFFPQPPFRFQAQNSTTKLNIRGIAANGSCIFLNGVAVRKVNKTELINPSCNQSLEATKINVYLNAFSVYSFSTQISKTNSCIDACLDDCSCEGLSMSGPKCCFLSDRSSLTEGESYYAVKANCSRNILDEFLFVPGYNFGFNDMFNIENIYDIEDCKSECSKVCNCSLVGLDPNWNRCWLKTGMYDLTSGLTTARDYYVGVGWQSLIRKCGGNLTSNFLMEENVDYASNTYRTFPNLSFHLCRFACASECDCIAFVIDADQQCLLKSGFGERRSKSGYTAYLRQNIDILNITSISLSENLLVNPGFDYTSLYFTNYTLNLTSDLSSFVYGWDLMGGQVNVHFGEDYPIDNYLSLCTLNSSSAAQITQSFPTEPGSQYSFQFSLGVDTLIQRSMTVKVNISPSTNGSTTFPINSTFDSIKGRILFLAEENYTDLTIRGLTQEGCVKVDNVAVTKYEFTSSNPDTVPQSSNPSSPSSSKSSNSSKVKVMIISIVLSFVFLLLVFTCIFFLFRKNKSNSSNAPSSKHFLPIPKTFDPSTCKEFLLSEIKDSTDNFSESKIIGKGGFSIVYKGMNYEGQAWAVKRLKKKSVEQGKEPQFSEDAEKFEDEVRVVSNIHHKNLVRLLGYHCSENERVLVYEFLENGSLRKVLDSDIHLNCNRRLQIANGIAQGLNYLHNHTQPQIIHRDIKSDNVLMDDHLEAKITDFGLMKTNEQNLSFLVSKPMGTPGYVDPEYARTGSLTPKSDVYSYGIILLELITRRHSIVVTADSELVGTQKKRITLFDWVKQSVEVSNITDIEPHHLELVLDPDLKGSLSPKEMTAMCQLVALAAQCLHRTPSERPDMSDVCSTLHRIMKEANESHVIQVTKVEEQDYSMVGNYYEPFLNGSQESSSTRSGPIGPAMSRPFEAR